MTNATAPSNTRTRRSPMSPLESRVNASAAVAAIPLDARETLPIQTMSGVILATPAAALAGAEVAGAGLAAIGVGAGIGEAID